MDDGEAHRTDRTRICIDFGTALSKASICLDPNMPLDVGVRPLPIGAVSGAVHPLLTPSILFVEGGRLHFGPMAFEHAKRGIENNRDAILSFKTVLGARDIQNALNERIPPSIDPTGTLRWRDTLVIYLAYLDQLIRAALATAPGLPPGLAGARRRYTSPVWRPGGGTDPIYEAVFNEAAAVSRKLGQLFLSPEGISIAQCKDALDKAAAQPGDGRFETGVFEPHAAAAASLAFTNAPTRFVMVFDMGAGTTDIAAFDFDESFDPPALTEIKEARQCSPLAGDAIDALLIDLLWRKRGGGRPEDEARFKRGARLVARPLKEALFTHGRCALKEGWRSTTLQAQEFMEDERFRQFLAQLGNTIATSLSAVRQRAEAAHAPVVDVVLAGGGAHLPFLKDLMRLAAKAGPASPVSFRVGPLSPASTLYGDIDPYFSDVFPQLAMSIGGALVELLDHPTAR